MKRTTATFIVGIAMSLSACTGTSHSSRAAADNATNTAPVDPVAIELLNPQPSTTVPAPTTSTPPTTTTETTTEPATTEPATTTTEPATLPPTSQAPLTTITTTPATTTPPPATPAPVTTKAVVTAPPPPVTARRAPAATVKITRPPTTRAARPATTIRTGTSTTTTPSAFTTTPVTLAAPPIVAGFDGETITLTNLGTRNHPAFGPLGRNINGAFTAHFNAVNRHGGIAGKYPVRIQFVETGYDPGTAQTAYQATKNTTVGYGSILGTPIVAALLPGLETDNITAAPASQDAEWAKHPALLPIGTTYQVQAINGASYWWETAGRDQTLCGLSVATSYGATGTEGLRYAAQANNATLGPILELGPTDTPDTTIGRLAAAGCKAVYLTTTPQQAIRAVLASAQAGYRPRWIWMSATWNDAVLTPTTSQTLETTSWVISEGPSYNAIPTNDTPGLYRMVTELRANDGSAYVDQANVGTILGWGQALVWEALLQRAVINNDLSRTGIQTAAKQLGTIDLAGLIAPPNLSNPTRNARPANTIFTPNGSYLLGLNATRIDYTSPAAANYQK